MDVFTIAVVASAAALIVAFGLMLIFDKGKRAAPQASAPVRSAGKR